MMFLIRRLVADKFIRFTAKIDAERLAGRSLPENVTRLADVPYIDDGKKGHLLDIYRPDLSGSLPVVIDVHGGGLVYGYKDNNTYYDAEISKRGFLVFSISYRLARKDAFLHGQIQDVVTAMSWVNQNLEKYGGDKDNVFVTGDSAGAYLAVLSMLTGKSPEMQEAFSVKANMPDFNAAGIVSGMMDITSDHFLLKQFRKHILERRHTKKAYYPYLKLDYTEGIKNLPPVYMVSSEEDGLNMMSLKFRDILKNNGVEHFLRYFEKNVDGVPYDHVFPVVQPEREESLAVIDEMTAYFQKFLR